MIDYASTVRGTAVIEPGVALEDLRVGDLVLGVPSADMEFRTLFRVVDAYGRYRVPQEPPVSRLERLTALLDGKELGVLVELVGEDVDGGEFPAMFTAARNAALDRVTGWSDGSGVPNQHN